jgi:YD repeat-containing protein
MNCFDISVEAFAVENGSTNWMVYDGNQVVAEVDGAGSLKKSYVYEGLDRAISMTTYGASTNTYYFIRDHLGSTLALTDGSGNIIESYRYDAWGRVLGVYNA